jgi:hypothetical protein
MSKVTRFFQGTTYHANDTTKQFFFSTDHCQDAPDGFVPVTTIYDKQTVIENEAFAGYVEIPNPDKKYQA